MTIGSRTRAAAAAGLLTSATAGLIACAEPQESALAIEVDDALRARIAAMSPLPPPPPDPTNRFADDPAAARFGQALFFDGGLSADGSVSCATCHDPERGFTDGRTLAVGLAEGTRHTPTLWNVAHHRWLTWDGRADSLWMQALDPIEDAREMGGSRAAVARRIHGTPDLLEAYVAVFGAFPEAAARTSAPHARPARAGEAETGSEAPAAVQAWGALSGEERAAIDRVYVHVGKALAAYQRRLVRGDAPFDTFVAGLLAGDEERIAALSPAAQRGLGLFLGRANCVLCHSGPAFSDGEFHNNSLPTLHGGEARDAGRYDGARVVAESPFNAAGPHSDAPEGEAASRVRRLRRTSESWGEFRTPSLRNLADRAPFMHQGQLKDLAAVLSFYSDLAGATGRNHHQEQILVPLRLTETESAELTAFLASLEGAPASPEVLAPLR